MNGGERIAQVLKNQGVRFLFTLCGGHISPVLAGAKNTGIRVIDVRHEATAVFAADAVSRLSGKPGVAVVTAGPGVTNTITAVKNAQMAQSPLIIIGGATATILKNRGALQDIDQMVLMKPNVKWAASVKRVRDLAPVLEKSFIISQSGVPGPVFIECPVDLLYDESLVREWYLGKDGGKSRLVSWYLNRHLKRLFKNSDEQPTGKLFSNGFPEVSSRRIKKIARHLSRAQKPVLLIGSQAMLNPGRAGALAGAVEKLGIPVFLSGMARGLLGADHPQHLRHKRKQALREADLVILAGTPCDFRLDYGKHISAKATYISVNRSREDLKKNRRPNAIVLVDPGDFLIALAEEFSPIPVWNNWLEILQERDRQRNNEIRANAAEPTERLNPLQLLQEIDKNLNEKSIIVADGGDFVASAAYILRPRNPLCWLDPGVFGTLGVGAGFALGTKLCRPDADVWLIYGDGAAGFSLAEFDTFVRHRIPIIAVVGNDGSWTQIAREQVEILHDDVATVLNRTNYHVVAQGFGGGGERLEHCEHLPEILRQARQSLQQGLPFLINGIIGATDFRKGSISM